MIPLNPYLIVINKLLVACRASVYTLAQHAGIKPERILRLYRRNEVPSINLTMIICAAFNIKLSDFIEFVEEEQIDEEKSIPFFHRIQ